MSCRCLLITALLAVQFASAQTAGTLNLYPTDPAAEQAALNQAVNDANGSAVDLTRALEQHLRRYPNSPRRSEIEASLYKSAVDAGDHARIVLYGEKMLVGQPDNQLEILDHVIRALLASEDVESARKALHYAERYETAVAAFRAKSPEGHTTVAQWADLADRALGSATVLKARATGNLGNVEQAVAEARRSWAAVPSAEAAHEIARWLVKLGRDQEAIDDYADAASIDDVRFSWSDRDRDRRTATALYTKLHGSAEGVGDVFVQAWERCAAALAARLARYKSLDPNYSVTNVFEFTLPPVAAKAAPLSMSSMKGKTVVVDFWATWCAPCIAQQPLIEEIRHKYAQSPDVFFLSLNADDDHTLIAPFIERQKWDPRVYLEAGLAGLLNVNSLPTVLVIDPSGKVYSRLTGFNTVAFGPMLSARIDEARASGSK